VASFDRLVAEAWAVPIRAWDFGWLDGRATEDRPSWRYFDQVEGRVEAVGSLLEIEAGTGAMIGNLSSLPPVAAATEGFPPSIDVAAPRLRARGVHLVMTSPARAGLPFAPGSFELVVCRHPVSVQWDEIARVLRPGGRYLAQHVGAHSLRTLTEVFLGPLPDTSRRDAGRERRNAERAGLVVDRLESERPRTAFHDIGAVVYFLRLVPWIVPGFSEAAHRDQLLRLHDRIQAEGPFECTASRTLFEVTKPG